MPGALNVLVPHRPNRIVSVASLTSAQAETLFPTTQGKVHIDFINVTVSTTEILSTAPVVVSFQHPSGSPTYATYAVSGFKGGLPIPGFILPAGGLQVTSNRATPVVINLFYEND